MLTRLVSVKGYKNVSKLKKKHFINIYYISASSVQRDKAYAYQKITQRKPLLKL